jgi:K+-sensing histidine kinase KdpD
MHPMGAAPPLAESLADCLFNRFYQAHARSYRSGMGLGLYIHERRTMARLGRSI